MINHIPHLVITSGDPAGIGPILCALLEPLPGACLIILCDWKLLDNAAQRLGKSLSHWQPYKNGKKYTDGSICYLSISTFSPVEVGILNKHNAPYVLALLQRAVQGCMSGEFSAMVTGPLNKHMMASGCENFLDHTSWLEEQTNSSCALLMMVSGLLRVACSTLHVPVKQVPTTISTNLLKKQLHVLHTHIKKYYGIIQPHIAVAGLNPHAGDQGILGDEEKIIISPAIEEAQKNGLYVSGPLSADTLFLPNRSYDVCLCMYHDQGLPAFKALAQRQGVNVTCGLSIIRTSVDHGTAYTMAAEQPQYIDTHSFQKALQEAHYMSLQKTRFLCES